MKKCPECERELDKHMLACQYCGKVDEAREKDKESDEKFKKEQRDKK